MSDSNRAKARRTAILNAIRAWTYDHDEETVTSLKGENGQSYRIQFDLVDRIEAELSKLDSPDAGTAVA